MRELGPGYCLDFFLMPTEPDYLAELKDLARDLPQVTFREPVRVDELPDVLNQYDVGVAFFPPKSINLLHCLPNKMYEYVQARVAIAIGPSPEMAAYVRMYGLGVVSEEFTGTSLAKAIKSMSRDQLNACKTKSHEAARILSYETQAEVLLSAIASVLEVH